MRRVEHRRVDRGLQVEPEDRMGEEELQRPLVLLVAAGSAERQHGPVVAHGQRRRERRARPPPPTSDAGSPSSSQNICARVPRQNPSPSIAGELWSQPPLGVAETRLPKRSVTSRWQVSPRVARPRRGAAAHRGDRRQPPAEPGRSSPEASSPTSARRAVRVPRESSSPAAPAPNRRRTPRGPRTRASRTRTRHAGARRPGTARAPARRAARAAAGAPAPGPTARS